MSSCTPPTSESSCTWKCAGGVTYDLTPLKPKYGPLTADTHAKDNDYHDVRSLSRSAGDREGAGASSPRAALARRRACLACPVRFFTARLFARSRFAMLAVLLARLRRSAEDLVCLVQGHERGGGADMADEQGERWDRVCCHRRLDQGRLLRGRRLAACTRLAVQVCWR